MSRSLPTEFAINMNLDKMMIIQQSDLGSVNQYKYFTPESPCHIYFVCKRPRIAIDKDGCYIENGCINLKFKIQKEDKFSFVEFRIVNHWYSPELKVESTYPYNVFKIVVNNEVVLTARAAVFLQSMTSIKDREFLDLEVLYVGQSYGVDGARTAPDRLKSHSTLQNIYSEAIVNNPDSEIWLALASFEQINLMLFDGRTKFTDQEIEDDSTRFKDVYNTLNHEGINEQQRINFTEAALIRYFEPPYNKIYKDSFPNPAHSTYSQCYDLDVNSVCIEMQTYELVHCALYSDKIARAPWNMEQFPLHSLNDRRNMFDVSSYV